MGVARRAPTFAIKTTDIIATGVLLWCKTSDIIATCVALMSGVTEIPSSRRLGFVTFVKNYCTNNFFCICYCRSRYSFPSFNSVLKKNLQVSTPTVIFAIRNQISNHYVKIPRPEGGFDLQENIRSASQPCDEPPQRPAAPARRYGD